MSDKHNNTNNANLETILNKLEHLEKQLKEKDAKIEKLQKNNKKINRKLKQNIKEQKVNDNSIKKEDPLKDAVFSQHSRVEKAKTKKKTKLFSKFLDGTVSKLNNLKQTYEARVERKNEIRLNKKNLRANSKFRAASKGAVAAAGTVAAPVVAPVAKKTLSVARKISDKTIKKAVNFHKITDEKVKMKLANEPMANNNHNAYVDQYAASVAASTKNKINKAATSAWMKVNNVSNKALGKITQSKSFKAVSSTMNNAKGKYTEITENAKVARTEAKVNLDSLKK